MPANKGFTQIINSRQGKKSCEMPILQGLEPTVFF